MTVGLNGAPLKTGGWGGPWVVLDRPKPPRVDRYDCWSSPPPERSARCSYWLVQIDRGWRPNRYLRRMGYDEAAEWYGVYMWEYLNEIALLLAALRQTVVPPA